MSITNDHRLTEHLGSFISESKKATIDRVLKCRTRYVTVVLEDIYQSHNASAVVRSCDCFGVQDLHIIENQNQYTINPNVTLGSSKWVDLFRYNQNTDSNTKVCLQTLKRNGYKIYATSPHAKEQEIQQICLDHKLALVFGTELEGVSPQALDLADATVSIPMHGFSESFNISVSAALCLHVVINKLHQSSVDWRLSAAETEALRLAWYRKSVRNSQLVEKAFNRDEDNG